MLKWYGRSFHFFFCIKINPYPIQSMVLYCVPVVMSLSLRICSYHQRIFFSFVTFTVFCCRIHFCGTNIIFSFFFFLFIICISRFFPIWHCVSVCMTKIEQYELNHKEYIYIYIFKETWLNCIFTFQNRFLIIVQFEKLLMDFFEIKHYLLRLKSLRNTVIQYLMSEYYVNTKN